MWIHTVVQGDTLRGIAERYGTSTREIRRLNELEGEDRLVPGLHLLVPGDTYLAEAYVLQRDDDMQRLGQRLGLSARDVEAWLGIGRPTVEGNAEQHAGTQTQACPPDGSSQGALSGQTAFAVTGQPTRPGNTLYLPVRVAGREVIDTHAYLVVQGNFGDGNTLRDAGRSLTYVTMYHVDIRPDGSLEGPNDAYALRAAQQARVTPLLGLTNLDENGFNANLAHAILANRPLGQRVLDNVIQRVRSRGYAGVNLDFARLHPEDRTLYSTFAQELGNALRATGRILAVSLPPADSGAIGGVIQSYDYWSLGRAADLVMLMTYEWGWSGGPPMPVSPITQVRRVVNYARSVIPARKIVMSIPLYGYDWTLPFVEGGEFAKALNF
ncbi:MAG: LysM peptidoglycan-binding domain-containing protein, partial [Alicyclobacillus sp.]|nr:LysM peptidoglycan-binding domain-containing protein [Alicyclobacillus sp.]